MYLVLQIATGLIIGAYAIRAIEYFLAKRQGRPRRKLAFKPIELLLGLAVVAAVIQIVYLF